MSANTKIKVIPETSAHFRGVLCVDTTGIRSSAACDFGIQIASDGRVWLCINGKEFLRFRPANCRGKMENDDA